MDESSSSRPNVLVNLLEAYTPSQLETLQKIMHEPYPHLEHGGGTFGKLIIEYPPQNIIPREEWRELINTIVAPEWENLCEDLKQSDILVRIVPTIWDIRNNIRVLGNAMHVSIPENRAECWVRIAFFNPQNNSIPKEYLLQAIVHEIAEIDYWMTSPPEDLQKYKQTVDETELLMNNLKAYNDLNDEKDANARAYRALLRRWPADHLNNFFTPPDEIT